jgi:hypothetical protein
MEAVFRPVCQVRTLLTSQKPTSTYVDLLLMVPENDTSDVTGQVSNGGGREGSFTPTVASSASCRRIVPHSKPTQGSCTAGAAEPVEVSGMRSGELDDLVGCHGCGLGALSAG